MRLTCILLTVAIAFLSSCDAFSATTSSAESKAIRETSSHTKLSVNTANYPNEFVREAINKVVEDDEEERAFSDPVINKYLHLFEDWAKLKESPESVFRSLELPQVMRRAYKSGKWGRLLNNENYTIYRKYQKYLKLLETNAK
ncbi:hypothetical protein PF005_g12892 [Phytophthora fragariae]|uniref:RxLR effector protein n=2 Tax=Phytophthora TaxID=4783 RepID=A0A6A3Z067_9STRA|nr:hypothetical protein PF009_g14089 [Phytophthora fragariae]KAE9017708.1 hypothetical protein PR002_g13322 [Phytophthora rubi]KAE9006181.1 hypothetical protein PF011_g11693 [Phytophthora fragariae]KAE9023299.1 hypothetical protein PR001_g12951 [Phytophthora rubi]KAE9107435.1 hypothetical protein PF007_g13047 [Phytophthora fragariae]